MAFLGLTLTACDPLEDINAELDANENTVIGSTDYTLTADDYADLELGFGSFSSLDDAKTLLPPFLAEKYPFWGDGSSVNVGFNLFQGSAEGVSDFTGSAEYSFTNDDYAATGSDAFGFYPNVDPTEEIPAILDAQIDMPADGDIVLALYDQYFETPEVGLANLYAAVFPGDFGDFEVVSVSGLDELGWNTTASNVTGSGFNGSSNAVEEWLISPEIDLSGEVDLLFQITQEIDLFGADPTSFDILISTDYTTGGTVGDATWNVFDFDKTAFGDLTTSEDLDFSAYDGETIHVAFKYTSTDSASARWRVESFAVRFLGVSGEINKAGEYFTYDGSEWEASEGVYYLSSADYDSMGEEFGQPGRFDNFSSSTPAANYLDTFLGIKYPFAQEEDEIFVIYKYFSSSSGLGTRGNLYTFTDGEWVGYESVIETTLQFGFENGVWVPDNTIRYTLVGTDYAAIVSALSSTYPEATGSMDNFGNFERRPGNAAEWTNDMVLEALNIVLDMLNPGAAEEQKYIVTVDVYTGSNGTEDFAVIKSGGEWVYQ